MSLAFFVTDRDISPLVSVIARMAPEITIQVWPNLGAPDLIRMAVVWNSLPIQSSEMPALSLVTSFGAGVDQLVRDLSLVNFPIARIVDNGLSEQMARYVCGYILQHQVRINELRSKQLNRNWSPEPQSDGRNVVILGAGNLGNTVKKALEALAFNVVCWAKHCRPGVITGREALSTALSEADYLVNVLPLTDQTLDILDAELFNQCKPGCYLVNVARGQHLVERDLLEALESGQLSGATLDVFAVEPLPVSHPFWCHPKVNVTPHCSALTDQHAVSEQIVDNYRRLTTSRPLMNLIDRQAGY
ncbi:glyoxylate/hydroxypyruvate reductase A [Corallincola platygyrae]|uniref:Glyoxylate/hydroxypyruvate reductase A n=1 Tax=Corallincola platygyrae TaxID=1193278 RepID=A0ABW4XII8_9GAMM